MEKKFKIGDVVYYVKKSYGKHSILEIKGDEVLLIGTGLNRFWAQLNRIFKSPKLTCRDKM